jgi:hypothetical protein
MSYATTAANGSNHIARRCPRLLGMSRLTCLYDLY